MNLQRQTRQSNFELLRIIAMLIIIAHHYVVLSGITELYNFKSLPLNMIFLQFFGCGGKMAINIFVLISSYFICLKKVIWGKVLKLVLEVLFYNTIITAIFLLSGYQSLVFGTLLKQMLDPILSIGYEFVGSFIVFYLFVPFLNIFIKQLSKKQHFKLMVLSIVVFSLFYTLSALQACRYVLWFMTLYFIGSYIRIYPNKFIETKKYAMVATVGFLLLTWGSIYAIDLWGGKLGFDNYYYFCIDSQKILALGLSVSIFVWFMNIHIEYNKWINTLAASAFGVLLIHSNSWTMRHFIWNDLLNVPAMYESKWLAIHFLFSISLIYVVCFCIDFLRIRFLEKPFFARLEKFTCLKKECFIEK